MFVYVRTTEKNPTITMYVQFKTTLNVSDAYSVQVFVHNKNEASVTFNRVVVNTVLQTIH